MKMFIKYVFLIAVIVGGCYSDFYSKNWAQKELKLKPAKTVIKGVLDVGFTKNHGMVFGILNNNKANKTKTALLILRIIILIGVSVFIIVKRESALFFLLPFILIVVGAWGNIFDQVRLGYVIDFIHIHAGTFFDWPFFFNLADAYLCIGMGLLILKGFKGAK